MSDRYEVIPFQTERRNRWNADILPPNEVIAGICGKSGSGKTYILLKLIPMIACQNCTLKYIIICSRIIGNEVYTAIERWCNNKKINYFFCSDVQEAKNTVSECINNKEDDEHGIIIMDDFNEGTITSKTNQYTKFAIDCFSKLRNYQFNLLFIVQNYTSIPVVCRANVNVIIGFNIGDRWSRDMITRDISSLTGSEIEQTKQTMTKIFKIISQKKHSYFLVPLETIYWYVHGITKTLQPYKPQN